MAWALAMAVANAFVGDGAAKAGLWLGVLFSHPLCDDVGSWQLPVWGGGARLGPKCMCVCVNVLWWGQSNTKAGNRLAWGWHHECKKGGTRDGAGLQVGLRSERPNLEQALLRWV